MKPLCVIPARRGSKRLPLKNILLLAGRPMLAYTVSAALKSDLFEHVIVSTEDPEIGAIAREYGAHFHLRPLDLAGDLVSATDVCIEVWQAQGTVAAADTAIFCLQPTSPLRSAEDIREAWREFTARDADYLVSATFIDPHYFHWAVHEKDGWWEMYFGSQFMRERPLLPPVYRPNGSIKIGRASELLETRNFFGPRLAVMFTPEDRSVHVAEQFDFDLAEYLIHKQEKRSTASA